MLEAGGDQERNIIQEVTGRKRRQAMISIIRIIICYRMSFDFPLGQGAAVLGLLRCTRYLPTLHGMVRYDGGIL